MKVQTFGRLFKLEAKKMVGTKGNWLFIALLTALLVCLGLRWIGYSIPSDSDAAYTLFLFEILVRFTFYVLVFVVSPLIIFKNLFFDDLKHKVIQLYVGSGYSRRQLFLAKSLVVFLSVLCVCILVMLYQMLEGIMDYNLYSCPAKTYYCEEYPYLAEPLLIALSNFPLLLFAELTIIYLALGSFLIKFRALNVILHIVYSCLLSSFVAGIITLLMAGFFDYRLEEAFSTCLPLFFFIANAVPFVYGLTSYNGSILIHEYYQPSEYGFSYGMPGAFWMGCVCMLIFFIYYVVKAWIMFNRKDF